MNNNILLNVTTSPIQTHHITWHVFKHGEYYVLDEIVENYYDHPEASGFAMIPNIESITKARVHEGNKNATPLRMFMDAVENISLNYQKSTKYEEPEEHIIDVLCRKYNTTPNKLKYHLMFVDVEDREHDILTEEEKKSLTSIEFVKDAKDVEKISISYNSHVIEVEIVFIDENNHLRCATVCGEHAIGAVNYYHDSKSAKQDLLDLINLYYEMSQ